VTVTLLCPQCSQPLEARYGVPAACPHCRASLPEQLGAAAAAALARETAPKPFLLKLLTFFLGFWGVLAIVLGIVNLGADNTTYSINGQAVTREEFQVRAGGMLVLMPVAALLALVAAWGLYRERPWGRHAAFALFAVSLLGPITTASRVTASAAMLWAQAVVTLLVLLPVGWYLYRKRSVVSYYRALTDRRTARSVGTGSPAI